MLEAIVAGLAGILDLRTFAVMLLGIAIGFVVGILPGLGGPVALALMLPFTFGMSPVEGFAFLLGMWVVTSTAGDITSVLFGVPGEATSAAAVLDGYPLTRKGQGGRALGAVLSSSAIGAIVGAVVLALTISIIRPVVLAFGPPEFFMLTVVGLTFVITLSSGAMLKGFVMVSLGLLVATIGIDPQLGIPRYTGDQLYLWDGVNIVPLVVGLFGGAEVLQIMLSKKSIASAPAGPARLTGTLAGVRDAFRHWSVVVRSAAIGVGVGSLPGVGGTVTQWIAYGQARQASKNPELFGKGAIDGVVAAGATNNARDAGSLIPTIAFGIPSGASSAVLLGGFMILGLNPGQEMLDENLHVTFSMVWIMIVSNIIAVALAVALARPLTLLTRVPGPVLVPGLLLLLLVGAFTATNSYGDILVMLCAAGVGVACIRWGWPRVPFLLAVVLGGLGEEYLNLSTTLFGTSWVTRPGVLVLALIGVASIVFGIRAGRRRAQRAEPAEPREMERNA
ncbi:tripartite tricarboxylate transporter permease [Pseudonocardia zijingensis]|jgi:TctA family transporter|uniref:DUF112 domain-containing protein n=1 Tax=Pseudonocardia zijingensis TaxID=153376 RepID=A0ABN1QGM1_9PSEU